MLQTIKQHAAFHLLTFLSRNRDRWPRWIINTALFAAGIIVAGMWMSVTHPAAGEILQNQLITLFLAAVTIAAAGLGLAIARGVWLSTPELARDMLPPISFRERYYLVFGKELRWRLPTFGQKVLPVSTWTPPDAGRDILVCSLPGEGPEQFADRMDEAIEQANVARWVLVMQQGNPNGVIYGAPDAVSKFFRDWPPFQTEKWLHEQRIVPAGTRFIGETETEFQDYVERFMLHFPEWSLRKKMSGEENRSGFVFQQFRECSLTVSRPVQVCFLKNVRHLSAGLRGGISNWRLRNFLRFLRESGNGKKQEKDDGSSLDNLLKNEAGAVLFAGHFFPQ